jgi:hypothetical protein
MAQPDTLFEWENRLKMSLAEINDQCRRYFRCNVVTTKAVEALSYWKRMRLFRLVKTCDHFNEDDHYDEHDFSFVVLDGEIYYWQFEYFDKLMQHFPIDLTDITNTTRVLTIMHQSEYGGSETHSPRQPQPRQSRTIRFTFLPD